MKKTKEKRRVSFRVIANNQTLQFENDSLHWVATPKRSELYICDCKQEHCLGNIEKDISEKCELISDLFFELCELIDDVSPAT